MNEFNIDKAYDLVVGKMTGWLELLVSMLPNMLAALLVFVFFMLLAKGLKRLTLKLSTKVSDNQALNRLLSTIVFIAVVGIGLFTALSVLKLDRALTSLLTGAGIIGLAMSFAFQDSATNFISGVFMAVRKPFNIDDIIETQGTMGTVHKINLRNTVLLSFQGQLIYIPNKEVYQTKLINYTAQGKRRIDLGVGVSYGDDLKKAAKVALDAIKDFPFIIESDKTSFVFDEFGDSSINGRLMFWIEYKGQVSFLEARSKAVIAVQEAFNENDITIPFPIRTLDFGIKGGEKLSEMQLIHKNQNS